MTAGLEAGGGGACLVGLQKAASANCLAFWPRGDTPNPGAALSVAAGLAGAASPPSTPWGLLQSGQGAKATPLPSLAASLGREKGQVA